MVTPEKPPQITELIVTVSPTGDSVTLDWSGYNQWAVGGIARFDIYRSDDGPFSSVARMTPILRVPAGTTSATLSGLTPYQDHYLAVVAVDAMEGFDENVIYSAAYVLSPDVVSREVSLFVENGPAEAYGQVISREASLVVVTPEAPPRITGLAVTVSVDGTTAALDWSSYDQWAVGDIVRFDIYYLARSIGYTLCSEQ